MCEVKLHGNLWSPSTCRVIWALSLKDIPYEYVQEDLTHKTPFLLHSNSLHQNLPVLVHGGKSVFDSPVILEYINEKWPHNPLLPADLLDRAKARFWIRFIDDKGAAVWRMFCSGWEEQKKAKQESLEMLRIFEEVIGEEKFFGGEKIGMVDLAFGQFVEWLGVIEEVIGEKLMESDSFPRLAVWSRAFMASPAIRESRFDRDRMVENFNRFGVRLVQLKPSSRNVAEFSQLFGCVCELVSFLCRLL